MDTRDTLWKGKAMDNLIISFSGRKNGNCDQIGQYIAVAGSGNDKVVRFRELNAHPCILFFMSAARIISATMRADMRKLLNVCTL